MRRKRQSPKEFEESVQDAIVAGGLPESRSERGGDEVTRSPRKKAKKCKDEPQEEGLHSEDVLMSDAESKDLKNQNDEVDEDAAASKNAVESTETVPDAGMQAESPTNEVSAQLEEVEIETPSKRKAVPSRTTRSSARRGSAAQETIQNSDEIPPEVVAIANQESVRRSGRTRRALTSHDANNLEKGAIKSTPVESIPKKAKASVKSGTPSRRPITQTADHLLTSKRSKIINAEVNMIFNENTWGLFNEEEKLELLSLLHPVDTEITPLDDTLDPPPRIPTPDLFNNLNNDVFRSAFAELQDDLATGTYEPSYIKKAQNALEARIGPLADAVDKQKNDEFEEYWGQKQAVYIGDAGLATNVTLHELCERNAFRVGDLFEYRRGFLGGIEVRKVLRLIDIELDNSRKKGKDTCLLTFLMPPGTKIFSVGDGADKTAAMASDIQKEGVEEEDEDDSADLTIMVKSLAQLDHAILDEDGTVKASDPEKYGQGYPVANAWKMFNITRINELLGSAFMIRQRHFEKMAATS